MKEKEIWKDVVGYEGWYEVSSYGRVRNVRKRSRTYIGRILKPKRKQNGYLEFCLCRNDKRHFFTAHRLVAEAFLGPRPRGLETNHKNGDKANNHLDNLEYLSHSDNEKHAYRIGIKSFKGSKNNNHILTENDIPRIRKLLTEGNLTQKEIGAIYNVHRVTIGDIKSERRWGWLKGKDEE